MYTENKPLLSCLSDTIWDVIIIGAGNAGICAAITAAEAGCSVLVIEAAPKDMRGGNTRHTRNLRAMHDEPTDILTDTYSFEEYFDDQFEDFASLGRYQFWINFESIFQSNIVVFGEIPSQHIGKHR